MSYQDILNELKYAKKKEREYVQSHQFNAEKWKKEMVESRLKLIKKYQNGTLPLFQKWNQEQINNKINELKKEIEEIKGK